MLSWAGEVGAQRISLGQGQAAGPQPSGENTRHEPVVSLKDPYSHYLLSEVFPCRSKPSAQPHLNLTFLLLSCGYIFPWMSPLLDVDLIPFVILGFASVWHFTLWVPKKWLLNRQLYLWRGRGVPPSIVSPP